MSPRAIASAIRKEHCPPDRVQPDWMTAICGDCEAPCWVTPSGQALMKGAVQQGFTPFYRCMDCAIRILREA